MMKGMASGNMPNLPGMPSMVGHERPRRPQAGPAGRRRRAARRPGRGPDFDMLSQLMGDGAELPSGMPGLPPGPSSRPAVTVNKGTKKKKKGGRVTPPKGR